MSVVIVHYNIFHSETEWGQQYHCPILVFITPEGARWNLGNLGKAMWDDEYALHPTWGEENVVLTAYCNRIRINIKNITGRWMDWTTLLEMLQTDDYHGDHRLSWWCGIEPGMKKDKWIQLF